MYSERIVEERLAKLVAKGACIKRRSPEECWGISAKLKAAYNETEQKYTRDLTRTELEFIASEYLLCKWDFRYFAERYCYIELDPSSTAGGVGPFTFWDSQNRAMELIARREEEVFGNFDKHGFSDGILSIWHKSRQLGATTIMRCINLHRVLFFPHTRSLAASLDEKRVHELYKRDEILLQNLPCYFSPKLFPHQIDALTGIVSVGGKSTNSHTSYFAANTTGGIGTGQQFDIHHCTEVGLWPSAERLKLDTIPTIPQSPWVFLAWESTAIGRGNFWHRFSEDVRNKSYGLEQWLYIFTPWYIESRRNRRIPPEGWQPLPQTIEHAKLVSATSAEYCGRRVDLTPDQMYWWETEYESNRKDGALHIFLTNYPATPEQSFQHHAKSALPIEVIERLRTESALQGMPYHVEIISGSVDVRNTPTPPPVAQRSKEARAAAPEGPDRPNPLLFHDIYTVAKAGRLIKWGRPEIDTWDGDARGILWVWEPHKPGETYGIGVDPTVGRTGWSRYIRVEADRYTNNGSIEVVRKGRGGRPDVQVAEYAAPVDPFELGDIVNTIGRLYAGPDDDDGCEVIIEVQPGPGIGTMRRLVELGYTNLWQWQYYAELGAPSTKSPGWYATPKSNRDLWAKVSRYITLGAVRVRSQWLAEEFADCRWNPDKEYAENPANDKGHGDRVRAFNLAVWMLNGWDVSSDIQAPIVRVDGPPVSWGAMDLSMDEIHERWDEIVSNILGN